MLKEPELEGRIQLFSTESHAPSALQVDRVLYHECVEVYIYWKQRLLCQDQMHTLSGKGGCLYPGRIAVRDSARPELGYAELAFDGDTLSCHLVCDGNRTAQTLPLRLGDIVLDAKDVRRTDMNETARALLRMQRDAGLKRRRDSEEEPYL